MNLKSIFLIIVAVAFSANVLYAQERICPSPKPLHEGGDELRIFEDNFTKEEYLESMQYLQKDFLPRLREYENIEQVKYSTEFWLSYFNSLNFVKGYVLKQAAINEIKSTNNKGAATKEFCTFLESAAYVD